MKTLKFTKAEAEQAFETWGFNCGPGALCAVLGMTPLEIRPHLLDFEDKGYTNPTLMLAILNGLGVKWTQIWRAENLSDALAWPDFGLARIQWGGKWTEPGVPMRVRYRQTHWVGVKRASYHMGDGRIGDIQIFDINTVGGMNSPEGWLPLPIWSEVIVPWIIKEYHDGANGEWWPTHCLEIVAP